MRFVIVTGMSGAGKSSVLKMLEDSGYFCVDNLPLGLVPKFAQMAGNGDNREYDKIAIGMDIRSGRHSIETADGVLKELESLNVAYEILFLEASDEVLVKRYKETRRIHPLAGNGRVEAGIEIERESLTFIKSKANYVLDTSTLLVRDLKQQVDSIFTNNGEFKNFLITVLSFGFKHGIPNDADMVFDVRFLPNPYYVPELKKKTGENKEVRDYVMNNPVSAEFLGKLEDMTNFLIPQYIKEGRNGFIVAIGCTGGKHRSVTIANELSRCLKDCGYAVKTEHRDIVK